MRGKIATVVALVVAMIVGGVILALSATGSTTTGDDCQNPTITTIVHHDAVTHEEYHFSKYTQTQSRTYVPGTDAVDHWWNWSPNHDQGPQDYTPDFPVDNPGGEPRGTWQGPHVNGGPMQDTYGTFQTGGGNSPFFHREHISDATPGGWGPWSDFGPWTQWTPVTHESWETSTTPLGSPEDHASWQEGNTQYHRVWQARFDGGTRTVTDQEAWDETVVIPNPNYPCPTEEPTPSDTPTPTDEPTPTDTPTPSEPTSTPTETPTETPTPTDEPTPTEPPTSEPPTTEPPTSTPTPSEPPTPGTATRMHRDCIGNTVVIVEETKIDGEWETTSTSYTTRQCHPAGQPPVVEEGM